jgi:hypothetical protein
MILDWMAKWSPLAILLSQLPNQSALAVVRNGHFLASSLRAAAALRAMPQHDPHGNIGKVGVFPAKRHGVA